MSYKYIFWYKNGSFCVFSTSSKLQPWLKAKWTLISNLIIRKKKKCSGLKIGSFLQSFYKFIRGACGKLNNEGVKPNPTKEKSLRIITFSQLHATCAYGREPSRCAASNKHNFTAGSLCSVHTLMLTLGPLMNLLTKLWSYIQWNDCGHCCHKSKCFCAPGLI